MAIGLALRHSSVLSGSLGDDLLLVKSWLGVTESDLVGGELVIAVHNGIKLGVHNFLIEWVKEDLGVLLAIHGNSGGFTSDVRWVDLKLEQN